MNSPKCKKLFFVFRCEDEPVKINVNSPQEKLVGYFTIIFSWHIFDPQFFIPYFQEKAYLFTRKTFQVTILVIESDSSAGRTTSHTGNSMKIGLTCLLNCVSMG